jgi:hypothetical protein
MLVVEAIEVMSQICLARKEHKGIPDTLLQEQLSKFRSDVSVQLVS